MLTRGVTVRGLGRTVLQARQDLALAHVAIAHQQELEQEIIGANRAAPGAHLAAPAPALMPGPRDSSEAAAGQTSAALAPQSLEGCWPRGP